VLRAVDERLGRTVALKVLPRSVSGNEAAKARFLQEARTTSRIDHPNVCTIFEGDEADDGRLFIAMAYYPGKTLAQRLEDGRELPVSDPQAIRLSESYLFTKFAVAQDYLILVDEERNGNVWVLDELPEL
jgi:serine/threonine protein kinase